SRDWSSDVCSSDLLQSITDFADGRECKECKKWINPNRQHTDCPHKEKEKPAPSGLLLHNIDEDFLRRYERWMKSQGNSITTTGIYLRYLRHIFNYAMDRRRKIIDPDLYPFGRGQRSEERRVGKEWRSRWGAEE